MQRTDTVPEAAIDSILAAAFQDSPRVYESYSECERHTRSFPSAEAVLGHIRAERAKGIRYLGLAVHYPAAKGHVAMRRIDLIPEKNNGATWRESVEGWGLIHLQLTFSGQDAVECRITVNSSKRAAAWVQTVPKLGDPSQWDWPVVEKHAWRLIRVLRKAAGTG